jgi:hypothetical protein
MFSVNNVDIMSLEKFETVLFNDDVIFILPPIGGGTNPNGLYTYFIIEFLVLSAPGQSN